MNAQIAIDFSRGRKNAQSKQAHMKLVPHKATMQDRVFALIEMAGERGLTSYEISDALKVPVHSVSGRLAELSFQGKTVTGDTRPNQFGNECTVHRVCGILGG